MKRSFLICVLCSVLCALQAQTYNNGVWYSLYDDSQHSMNTISSYTASNIFAPTTGQFQFKWTYSKTELTGWFATNATHIYQSADGGSSSEEIGTLTDKTWNTEHTTDLQVNANINWLQWDRPVGNTHIVKIYNLHLPLAKHILLPSGTYGTTTASHAFGELDMLTVSEAYNVSLRSFLTAGDITITSSMPEIFHVGAADNTTGITYAVGNNACASANGTAAKAGGANLGKIANYGFAVYFTPQEARAYEATITITDGTSTATVTVSGTGLYVAPPVPEDSYYAYAGAICAGESYSDELFSNLTEAGTYVDTIPNVAGADSIITFTLVVNPVYAFEQQLEILKGEAQTWQNIDLSVLPAGDTTLVAAYKTVTDCDSTYVLNLHVKPLITTYGNDTISVCKGELALYEGKTYRRSTVDSVLLATPNIYGGDSIVELVVNVYPAVNIEMNETIAEGEATTWQDIDLSTFAVGDTTLVASYFTVHGCDSTYVLHLTVTPNTQGLTPVNEKTVKAQKVVLNGQIFIRKGDAWYDLTGRKRL